MTQRTPGGRGSLAKQNFSYTQSWISFIRPHQNWTLQWVLQTKTILLPQDFYDFKRPNMTPNDSLCLIDQLKSFRSHLRSFKLCGSVVFCGVSDTHCDTSLKMFRNTSKHIDKYSIFVFCLFVCLFVLKCMNYINPV